MNATYASTALRDDAIGKAYQNGFCNADIARAFGLSPSRISQILMRDNVPKRSPCILPLKWEGELMV